MLIKNFFNFKKLIKNHKFIISENKEIFLEYEKKLFLILSKLNIKFNTIDHINALKNPNVKYVTLDPLIYEKNIKNLDIKLFIFSVDKAASNFLGLYKYSNIFKNKNLKFKKKTFKNFLLKYDTKVKIKSKINFILSYINLFIYKNSRKLLKISIEKSEVSHNGMLVGKAYYNRYINGNVSKKFHEKYNYVRNKLETLRSKRIYEMVAFSKPFKIWKHKYFQFYLNNQYFDYNRIPEQSTIINIGVNDGFEIPFFLAEKPKLLLNIDPTGEESLNKYVKHFYKNYSRQTKIIFCKDFLYKNDFVYKKNIASNPTTLKIIIEKYKLEKIDFIKSDIEGMETELVNELESIMKKFRPIVAISIYHLDKTKSDVNFQYTDIPLRLMQFCKDYLFTINHYTYHRSETILYCIPREKF